MTSTCHIMFLLKHNNNEENKMILALDDTNGVVEISKISHAQGYTIVSVDKFMNKLGNLKPNDTLVTEVDWNDYKKIRNICEIN